MKLSLQIVDCIYDIVLLRAELHQIVPHDLILFGGIDKSGLVALASVLGIA